MKKNKITGEEYDIVESFNYAIDGIFEAIRSERHMKFHAFITVIAIMVCIFSDITTDQMLALGICITLVWLAELLNSAVESVVDMVTAEYHPLAKRAKDIAAGAVLVTGINALFVGYIIFSKRVGMYIHDFFLNLRSSFQNSLALILVLIVVLVILIKSYYKRGSYLRGGLPSGHSALGASAFTAITFLTHDSKIFFLAFILLVLVLQSRVEGKIHTFKEAILGAILGAGVTYIALKIIGF